MSFFAAMTERCKTLSTSWCRDSRKVSVSVRPVAAGGAATHSRCPALLLRCSGNKEAAGLLPEAGDGGSWGHQGRAEQHEDSSGSAQRYVRSCGRLHTTEFWIKFFTGSRRPPTRIYRRNVGISIATFGLHTCSTHVQTAIEGGNVPNVLLSFGGKLSASADEVSQRLLLNLGALVRAAPVQTGPLHCARRKPKRLVRLGLRLQTSSRQLEPSLNEKGCLQRSSEQLLISR